MGTTLCENPQRIDFENLIGMQFGLDFSLGSLVIVKELEEKGPGVQLPRVVPSVLRRKRLTFTKRVDLLDLLLR
jgi:hypothetical protein